VSETLITTDVNFRVPKDKIGTVFLPLFWDSSKKQDDCFMVATIVKWCVSLRYYWSNLSVTKFRT